MKGFLRFFRQLKWRTAGAHMAVVIVGVAVALVTARIMSAALVPSSIQSQVASLSQAQGQEAIAEATAALSSAFDQAVFTAVGLAALAAIVTGIASSLLLAGHILRPVQEISASSQRIADGRYDERVAVPELEELAALAENFNQMAEALQDVERQRVALIANVAHELRTPLTALGAYLEGLMDGLLPADPETFAQMSRETRRLKRLVDDLQALSRVESGQFELQMEAVDVREIASRVSRQLLPQAESKDLTLRLNEPATLARAMADPDRVAQILTNLLGNAIHYTPEGGNIAIDFSEGAEAVRVAVSDTGIGIPADALPFVFERFFRVEHSHARRSGGSGIGLTIARRLARDMNGELLAESAGPGQGSTFILSLARAEA